MKNIVLFFAMGLLAQFSLNAQTGSSCNDALQATVGTNNADAAPVWFQFTPEKDTLITISSCGADSDTFLEVYDACDGALVVSNDDDASCETSEYSSLATWAAKAGVSYKILWSDKWSAESFAWELSVQKIPDSPEITSIKKHIGSNMLGNVTITFNEMYQLEQKKNSKVASQSKILNIADFISEPEQNNRTFSVSKDFVPDGDEEVEPNGGQFQGQPTQLITPGSENSPKKITGNISTPNDFYDFFEVNLTEPGDLYASLELESGTVKLWILNDENSGTTITCDNSQLYINNYNGQLLSPGRYYIVIQTTEQNEQGFNYNLAVWQSQPPAYMVYRNNTLIDSLSLNGEYTDDSLAMNNEYCYQIRQVLNNGQPSELSEPACIQVELTGGELCYNAQEAVEGENEVDFAPSWFSYQSQGYDTIFITTELAENDNADTRVFIYENCQIADPGNQGNNDYLYTNDDIILGENLASELTFLAVPDKNYIIYWDDRWSTEPFKFLLNTIEVKPGDIIEKPIDLQEDEITINDIASGFHNNYNFLGGANLQGNDIVYSFNVESASQFNCIIEAEQLNYALFKDTIEFQHQIESGEIITKDTLNTKLLLKGDYFLMVSVIEQVQNQAYSIDFSKLAFDKINVSFNLDMNYADNFDAESSQLFLQPVNNESESRLKLTEEPESGIYKADTLMFPYEGFSYTYEMQTSTSNNEFLDDEYREIQLHNDDTVITDIWGIMNPGANIGFFGFPEQVSPTVISNSQNQVNVLVGADADITQLTPTIVTSDSAEITPGSGIAQDFTQPFNYTVKSFTGEEKVWTVNVSKLESGNEVVYWEEDFSDPAWANTINENNLYNGATLPTGWSLYDGTGNNFNWHWTQEGPRGLWTAGDDNDWSTPANELFDELPQGTSYQNGLMIMESDYYNTDASGNMINPSVNMDAHIQFGPIDLSSAPTAELSFSQYFHFCCLSGPNALIEVTNNYQSANPESTVWHSYRADDHYTTNTYTYTNDRVFKKDISSIAAGEPEVYIRISKKGYSHYFWMIDDIKISAIKPYSLALKDAQIKLNEKAYTQIPQHLNPTISGVSALVENTGASHQWVKQKVSITRNNSVYLTKESKSSKIESKQEKNLVFNHEMELLAKGDYTINLDIRGNMLNEDLTDNHFEQSLKVTDTTYSTVAENSEALVNVYSSYGDYQHYDGDMFAHTFKIPELHQEVFTGASFFMGDYGNTTDGYAAISAGDYWIKAHVYREDANGDKYYTGISSEKYTLEISDINNWVYVPFTDSNMMIPGNYVVAIETHIGLANNGQDFIIKKDSESGLEMPQAYRFFAATQIWYKTTDNYAINLHLKEYAGQALPIKNIQYAENETGSSTLSGYRVKTSGIVFATDNQGYYLHDAKGRWNSIYVADTNNPAIGDSIALYGKVTEQDSITTMEQVDGFEVLSVDKQTYEPVRLPMDQKLTEGFESVLVTTDTLVCDSILETNGQWLLTKQEDTLAVDGRFFSYAPVIGGQYILTGALKQTASQAWILPRMVSDVVSINPSDKNDIVDFYLPELIDDAVIDTTEKTVFGKVTIATNIEDLLPEIKISQGAKIFPGAGQVIDFTNPVNYQVIAENGDTAIWKVTIKRNYSTDTTLSEITINDEVIDNFNPETMEYVVSLPIDSVYAPVLAAKATHEFAQVDIQQASEIPDTAFIIVTAQDTLFTAEYKVVFNHEPIYTVTFLVTDANGPLSEAFVNFQSKVGTTNGEGSVMFDSVASDNDIFYTIEKENYNTVEGYVDVVDQDITVEEMLVPVSITGARSNEINIFPNPTSGHLTIQAENPASIQWVQVVNAAGKTISVINNMGSSEVVDLSHQQAGMYIVKIISDSDIKQFKIFKQ